MTASLWKGAGEVLLGRNFQSETALSSNSAVQLQKEDAWTSAFIPYFPDLYATAYVA